MSYTGLTTVSTNAQGQKATRSTNAMGWLIQSKDEQNNAVNYDHDSDGNLTAVTDPAGNVTTMAYDSRGNKTSMEDHDLGLLTYEYNTLGLLTKQTYGGGQSITITYDLLDRKIRQVEKKNASTTERTLGWSYDLGNKGIGKISADSIDGVVSKQYVYDNSGRIAEEKEKIEGLDYSTVYEYDGFSRVRFLNYPGAGGFKLRYNYDAYGHLDSICQPNPANGNCQTTLWRVDSLNNRGQVTRYTLGNGLITRKNYDANTGFLLGIQTGNAANGTLIQDLSYQYSPLGNLTQRKDNKFFLTEDFQYDNLNRLAQAQVTGQPAVTVTYNAIGNITFKSNVGAYTYGEFGAGPHLLTSINHLGIPNCFYEFQGEVDYTAYNYPRQIREAQDTITFSYDAARMKQTQRFVKNGALKWEKHYINGLTERVEEGGLVKTVLHIKALGETIAVLKQQNGAPDTLQYLHHDHLGSLQAISRSDGTLVDYYSYDAWGKPRQALSWQPLQTPTPPPPYQRGFTGHEMMGIEDLVHMNARLYDPAVGRFLSADPFVQAPEDLQSLNRASYVKNNPLSYIDPSGFFFKSLFKKIGGFIKENVSTITSIALNVGLNILAPGLGTIVSSAIAGFGGALVGTLVNGGSIGDGIRNGLRSAVVAGVTAGLTEGVDGIFNSYINTLPTDGLLNRTALQISNEAVKSSIKGTIAEKTGGSFQNSFLLSFGPKASLILRNSFVEWRAREEWALRPGGYTEEQIKQTNSTTRTAVDYAKGKAEGDDYRTGLPRNYIFEAEGQSVSNVFVPQVGITPGEFTFFINENSRFMQFIAKNIPGMNSMAVAHDFFAGYIETGYSLIDYPLSVSTIPIFMGIEYTGLASLGVENQHKFVQTK